MPESEMSQNLFLFGETETTATSTGRGNDEALAVEQACLGDTEAFAKLYKSYLPLVHGIVLSRVPYDDAKDIVQEVFLTAYRKLHTLRDTNALGSWLARIAKNQTAEYYRHEKPTEELTDDLRGKKNSQTEANEILTAIKSLPDTYRETLVLRLIEGMTGNEIALRTGMTPDSVRVNLHRGMEQLRHKLGI